MLGKRSLIHESNKNADVTDPKIKKTPPCAYCMRYKYVLKKYTNYVIFTIHSYNSALSFLVGRFVILISIGKVKEWFHPLRQTLQNHTSKKIYFIYLCYFYISQLVN